jgi:hypothetical protein
MIDEVRNSGKFTRPERKRLAGRSENALVTRTGHSFWNTAREYALWGGGGDRNAALCRKKG